MERSRPFLNHSKTENLSQDVSIFLQYLGLGSEIRSVNSNPKKPILTWIVILFGLILTQQNCGKPATPKSETSGATSNTTPSALIISDSAGRALAADAVLNINTNYKVGLSPSALSSIGTSIISISQTHQINGSESCQVQATLASDGSPQISVQCPEAGYLNLTLLAQGRSGSATTVKTFTSERIFRVPGFEVPAKAAGAQIFRIADATNGGAWNSSSNAPNFFVGQTLRIVNRDRVDHRWSTPGNRPCGSSPQAIPPGGVFDCRISAGYNSATDGLIFDSLFSNSARFYMAAYDGRQIFANRCHNGTHGALGISGLEGSTAAQIQNAVRTVNGMRGLQNQLTTLDYQALEWALRLP